MAKMKVHELAKELEINSKDIIETLANTEYAVKAAQSNVEDAACAYTVKLEQTVITEQLSSKCAPTQLEKRLCADGSYETAGFHVDYR